jgi:hypothetical protein
MHTHTRFTSPRRAGRGRVRGPLRDSERYGFSSERPSTPPHPDPLPACGEREWRETIVRFSEAYCVGPSWQDCGAVGESRCQVGTSHFEQAASERPSASDETMARKGRTSSRTRRSPLPGNFVRILNTPHAPYYSALARDCDLLAAPGGGERLAAGFLLSYASIEIEVSKDKRKRTWR